VYYEMDGEIPDFELVQNLFDDISPDQIATHFDSYMGYIEAALPELILPDIFYKRCLEYSNNYYSQHGVYPSAKAVSSASKTNNLLFYSEQEVAFLLKNRLQISRLKESSANPAINTLDNKRKEMPGDDDNSSKEKNYLLNKHSPLIFSPSDIRSLSKEDRAEIKNIFRSEFYFLKKLKEYRNQVNG